MRLIDGDALYESLADLYKERGFNDREVHFSLKDMEMNINGAPAVDVVLNFTGVEVVRCHDCKYYIADGCDECVLMSAKSIIAGINNKRWFSDFYCAWGERREDGKTD